MRAQSLNRVERADALAGALPPGVHVLERGWLSSNSVLFEEGDRLSVVDTGYVLHARQTAALIDRVGRGRPLARIINTHLHSDHVGGNARLARGGAVSIQIPAGAADAVRAWDVERLGYRATAQRCPRFGFDRVLRSGDELELGGRGWQVLAAAGHDPHMLMLYESDRRILVSADALWANGFGAIFPEIEGDGGFVEQRASLDLIGRLQPLLVIPGHGPPFRQVAAALQRAYRRLDALQSSPPRNARQVLKVLVKFWLLQVGQAPLTRLIGHFGPSRYARIVHQRYFADLTFEQMLEQTVWQLCAAGAAALDGSKVRNVDGADTP
ncbi:MAG TPA: MBL fold metallo-hydrolase [Burkholderiaceae bacterium]|jgi:glyoxylase-like metal-dependent hydrolase (beta-lactamase superfamily II)|nr:MBL fold metallo-hydrolase [Burkholderiaceae bacterium]